MTATRIDYHALGDPACIWQVIGPGECPGCTTQVAEPAAAPGIVDAGRGLETKQAADDGGLIRYRCESCGHTGRWLKDGNLADDAHETHRWGDIETGRSRCRRRR